MSRRECEMEERNELESRDSACSYLAMLGNGRCTVSNPLLHCQCHFNFAHFPGYELEPRCSGRA